MKSKLNSFDIKVLKEVSKIPLGEVRSYGWIARKIKHPHAQRAVGVSLKKNPYPLIIPCHRVIKSDGSLGGYSLGVKFKKILLDLEMKIKEEMV